MATERFEKDMSVIGRLSDYPGSQDGLSTQAFREKFDEGGIALQEYLNEVIVPAIDALVPPSGGYLGLTGGTMEGAIDMGGNRVTGLGAPSAETDAVPKGYVLPKTGGTVSGPLNVPTPTEDAHAANKGYVDAKHLSGTVSLPASGWADISQTVSVPGILATDNPHYTVVYSSSREAEKEAFALVDQLETTAGAFVFTCFSEAPTIDLTIGWEVNR